MKCSSSFDSFYFYFTTISGALSILGALVVMAAILKFDKLKTYSFKILFYMSITDLVRGIAAFFQNFFSHAYCGLVAYTINLTFVSGTLCAVCISHTLYQIIVKEDFNFEKSFKYWLIICFVVVPLFEAAPFITGSFTYIDGMCQISLDTFGNIYRFVLLYIPGIIFIGLMFWFFAKVYLKAKLLNISINDVIFDRGLIYPIVLTAIIIPLTLSRLYLALDTSCLAIYISFSLNGVVILHGFINCLVFFSSNSIRRIIMSKGENTFATMNSLNISFRSTINE